MIFLSLSFFILLYYLLLLYQVIDPVYSIFYIFTLPAIIVQGYFSSNWVLLKEVLVTFDAWFILINFSLYCICMIVIMGFSDIRIIFFFIALIFGGPYFLLADTYTDPHQRQVNAAAYFISLIVMVLQVYNFCYIYSQCTCIYVYYVVDFIYK